MPDHIDPDAAAHFIREATIAMDHAAHTMNVLTAVVEQLRQDRAELRKALYDCAYCLTLSFTILCIYYVLHIRRHVQAR